MAKYWTEKEDAFLRQMAAKRMTAQEIADILGRSKDSVACRGLLKGVKFAHPSTRTFRKPRNDKDDEGDYAPRIINDSALSKVMPKNEARARKPRPNAIGRVDWAV